MKKNSIIKIVSLVLLSLVLVMGLASCSGSTAKSDADDASGTYGSIEWQYEKSTKTLTLRGTGAIPDAESSEKVGWYEVRHSVESVSIASGITAIGDYAFYYMPKLEGIRLPGGVVSIGKQAFAFCSALESITLPENCASIGESAFEGCGALKNITAEGNITSLGERAFAFCSKLETVYLPGALSEIPAGAFKNCSALLSVSLGLEGENTPVGEGAFDGAKLDADDISSVGSGDDVAEITISYVYADGSEAAADTVLKKQYGDSYSVESPVIEGYTADKLVVEGVVPTPESDAAEAEEIVVTVTYTKNDVETTDTEETTEAVTTEPEEGMSKGMLIFSLVVLGVVLVGIAVGGFMLMRSDKNGNSRTVVKNKDAKGNNKNNNNKKK